ncbi:MAG TPA: hypothetical protein EYP10_09995, partial [Armatimonadetes bacterium]|nr:hypothetical protein [Armatimonadota bacterium]
MTPTYESRLADKQALFIKREVMPRLATVDSIVFDIDGVIVDVSESFRVVICEAVRIYAEQVLKWDVDVALLTPDETELFKRAGGFNSDWDLVQAAMLFYLFKGVRHGVKKASALRKLPPHLEDFTMEIARAGGGLENAERV